MRLVPVACALLIVIAGCAGVMDTATPSPTESDETATLTTETSTLPTSISVVGEDLPVDPDAVFDRVLNLTGQRVGAPVVYVESANESSPDILDHSQSSFRTSLGFDPPERTYGSEGPQLSAYTPSDGESVHVYEGVTRNATVSESILAHEFVHIVQYRAGWGDLVWGAQDRIGPAGELTYDGRLTYYLVLEGAASYVERQYRAQFMPNVSTGYGQSAYANASARERLNLARYVLGAMYVDDVASSPADIGSAHRDPPVSTEQVLHRNDDPVADLRVAAGEVGEWESGDDRQRQGELFLRIALRTELNKSTASKAAAGWGADWRVTYERENKTNTAWVLRWDNADNATEFETAFRTYLGEKATRADGVWRQDDGNATYRLSRPGNQTVVVFLGDGSFVRNANVTVDADSAVQIDDEN